MKKLVKIELIDVFQLKIGAVSALRDELRLFLGTYVDQLAKWPACKIGRQRLQRLMLLLNAAALHMMDQDMCDLISLFLQSHTALKIFVAFIFCWSLNDEWWL